MAHVICSTVLLFLVCIQAMASGQSNYKDENIGEIKGTVVEQNTNLPVEYATVAVYKVTDSTVVTGTISDAKGKFNISNLDEGRYYLEISFVGYEKRYISELRISPSARNIDLGKVELEPSAQALKEVEIVGTQRALEYKIDKKVVNVGKMQTSASMTAAEVLQNIPSVKVDIDGNVSLRGSSGFTVLIDGKPTVLEPSDALRQLPASTIENIEIITNPSVKYRPDGTSGIINVITKKNKTDGITGQVSINSGMYDRFGGDALFNYRAKSVNYLFGADYNTRKNPGSISTDRQSIHNDTTFNIVSNGSSERYRKNWSIHGGLEIDFSQSDNLSLSGRYGYRYWSGNGVMDYWRFSNPSGIDRVYTSIDERYRGGNFYSVNANYKHNFGKSDHNLNLQVDFGSGKGDERTTNELFDSERRTEGKITYEEGPNKHTEVRLDYTLPFSENNKIEAGFEGRYYVTVDNTALDSLNTGTDEYEQLLRYSNSTKYYQDISGVYGIYSGTLNKLSFQLGLRAEYLHQITSTGIVMQKYTLNKFDYYPTAHFSFNLPRENQVLASYTRRIERPRSYMFEPFITWIDAYTIRRGNPNLIPEYIDSYELGYMKKFNKSSFSLEGYYRVTNNKIETIRSAYDNNIVMQSPINVGKDFSLGVESNLNLTHIKWWEINLTGNFYDYQVRGTTNNTLNSFNWAARFNNNIYLPLKSQFQCNVSYNSATVTSQGRDEGFLELDVAYRIDFFKRALAAVVQVHDLLSTGKYENTTEGEGFYYHSKYRNHTPYVTFTLSYRINKYLPEKPDSQQNEGMGGSDY